MRNGFVTTTGTGDAASPLVCLIRPPGAETFRIGTSTAANVFRPVNGTPTLTNVAATRVAASGRSSPNARW